MLFVNNCTCNSMIYKQYAITWAAYVTGGCKWTWVVKTKEMICFWLIKLTLTGLYNSLTFFFEVARL